MKIILSILFCILIVSCAESQYAYLEKARKPVNLSMATCQYCVPEGSDSGSLAVWNGVRYMPGFLNYFINGNVGINTITPKTILEINELGVESPFGGLNIKNYQGIADLSLESGWNNPDYDAGSKIRFSDSGAVHQSFIVQGASRFDFVNGVAHADLRLQNNVNGLLGIVELDTLFRFMIGSKASVGLYSNFLTPMAASSHKYDTIPDVSGQFLIGSGGRLDLASQVTGILLSANGGELSALVKAQTSIQGGDVVENTTTETNFATNYSIPSNTISVGKVITIHVSGVYSLVASAGITIKVKMGSTVLGSTGSYTSTLATNVGWNLDFYVIGITTGTSGTIEAQGEAGINNTTTDDRLAMSNTATITVNTTTSQTLQISAQWNVASVSNTITMRQFIVHIE